MLPLIGGVLGYFFQSGKSYRLPALFIGAGLIQALRLLTIDPEVIRWSWVPGIELGIYIDHLSAVLVSLVYFISLLVHIFSMHYMCGDPGLGRYWFKLGFFTTSMLGLLISDHLLLLFVFWEMVGFSSYLLIGFWFKETEKATSARTAFMVNRVADAGLIIGIIVLITMFGQAYISELNPIENTGWLTFAGIALAIGAFGKSAQFPFFGWLNKAMAGPTPVSALIHAATMVTAGIYLLVRVYPVLTPVALYLVAITGALTAFIAAVAALFQNDIKAVLAYSTISQLGYMIMGVGVGAYESSIFHLWTHAFFKAGLFLAAGNVIHFMHKANHDVDGQDMRNMGGLKKYLPFTFLTYLICGSALAGLPLTSGFLSKEGILGASLDAPVLIVPALAFVSALLTPFYITRQILLVFTGEVRKGLHVTNETFNEPWKPVKMPFALLALGSIWIFSSFNPFNAHGWYLGEYVFGPEEPVQSPYGIIVLMSSIVLVAMGIGYAYTQFKPGARKALEYKNLVEATGAIRFFLSGWAIDRVYAFFNQGTLIVSNFAALVDRKVVDRLVDGAGLMGIILGKGTGLFDRYVVDGIVNGLAGLSRMVGRTLAKIQAPGIQTQLAFMLFIMVLMIYWYLF
ncbi:NADH-quinone oxidoreductase subunit L [Marinoscillum sp. MHG1-6]|uniref:NADH-quinone oxidoreductase subunit 5 family protein n=1 Tax=Marinoscillum sp. MHG1-6 TaxID=2959627 RepID=UPI0021582A3E|nr:NADH-quinone oxidoreductase subunit L [Marinoscillum sp. MHG1-6]